MAGPFSLGRSCFLVFDREGCIRTLLNETRCHFLLLAQIEVWQSVLVRQNELVSRREELLAKVLEHLLRKSLLVLLLRFLDGRCSLSKQHGPLLPRVDLVLFFVYEIDAHAHIIVDINLVRLVQLNTAVFVF